MASVLTPSSAHYPRGMPYDYGYPDMLMQQQQQQQQQQLQHQQHQGLAPYGRYSHDMYASGSRRAQSHMTFESEHAGYGYPDERSFAYYEDPGFGSTSCPPAGPSFDVDFELELAASQALGRSTIADPSDLSELKFPELPADLLDSAPEYEFVSMASAPSALVCYMLTNPGPMLPSAVCAYTRQRVRTAYRL